MGKTRDLFKEIRNTKGIFHTKMFTTKDRYGMDLREAEDIQDVAYLTIDSIFDSGEYHSFPNLTWKLSFLFNCRFDFITNQLS